MAIINSLLDQDFYKFSMSQCILHQFPNVQTEYKFKCRNKGIKLLNIYEELNEELDNLCKLRFKEDELEYLSKIRFLKDDFIEYLRLLQLNRKYIHVKMVDNDDIEIRIKGNWINTIWFEVPVLAIINELYYKKIYKNETAKLIVKGVENLQETIKYLKNPGIRFSEFGTRRRFSMAWQQEVIETLMNECPDNYTGTSNVYYSYKYGTVPIGTMAHEMFLCGQALTRVRDSQKYMLQAWCSEYRGDLGIALSDTFGFDAFLNDFDLYFAKLFDGCRHDSGDPFIWTNKLISHYKKLKINPLTKRAVYSDCLTGAKVKQIYDTYKGQIDMAFGLGTHLVNNMGVEALQNVIKVVSCNGQPVAKVSDSEGKGMCEDAGYLTYLKSQFGIE